MAELQARRFAAGEESRWDAFVRDSTNGTLFHQRRFLAYHPPGRFEDHSLLILRGERLVGVFPAAVVERKGRRWLKSHPGASYGGLVVAEPPGLERAQRMTELVLESARAAGLGGVELRTSERIFQRTPCEELEFALRLARFHAAEVELSTCVELSRIGAPSTEAILASFDPSASRAARKALAAGVRVRGAGSAAELAAFWQVLARNLERHGARPTHSCEELAALRGLCPDAVQLFAAFEGERLVAGVLALACNASAAHTFYFASERDAQPRRPLNLVVVEVLRWALLRGLRYVNFGISTEAGGAHVNAGLFRFKESFGGGGVTRVLWTRELDGGEAPA
jgi:hypothetical protein